MAGTLASVAYDVRIPLALVVIGVSISSPLWYIRRGSTTAMAALDIRAILGWTWTERLMVSMAIPGWWAIVITGIQVCDAW